MNFTTLCVFDRGQQINNSENKCDAINWWVLWKKKIHPMVKWSGVPGKSVGLAALKRVIKEGLVLKV